MPTLATTLALAWLALSGAAFIAVLRSSLRNGHSDPFAAFFAATFWPLGVFAVMALVADKRLSVPDPRSRRISPP
jgi:hypothetical protein